MEQKPILFLLKATKEKYVKSTLERGRFCFCHPTVFSKWEDNQSAQYDRWEGHASVEASDIICAPIVGYQKDGFPIYDKAYKIADKAIVHSQTGEAQNSPICCFRTVERSEISMSGSNLCYTLGETAQRIITEFGYDSYVLIQAEPFMERIKKTKEFRIAGSVIYQDIMNQFPQRLPDEYDRIAEQLLRKDRKYEWQKEYRIILNPTKEPQVFLELGSIEDIAKSGKLVDLLD